MNTILDTVLAHFGGESAARDSINERARAGLSGREIVLEALAAEDRARAKQILDLKAKSEGDRLASEQRTLDRELSQLDAAEEFANGSIVINKIRHGRERGGPYLNGLVDPYTYSGEDTAEGIRSKAKAAVNSWKVTDEMKDSATQVLESAGRDAADPLAATQDIRGISEFMIRHSHPLYMSAFGKYMNDPQMFVADFTSEEAQIWRENREYNRVHGATLDTTGAVLPSPLDPAIVLTNVGVKDPMRSVARHDRTMSKTKRYIVSAGSTFSFDAEKAEVSDDTHTETEIEITTHKAQGFIQASIEAAMDQPDLAKEVSGIIRDAKVRLEADKFINGSGTNEPWGIQTRLDGSASELAPATPETFASADVYSTIEALPPRWRPNATWQAELSTINAIDQFETSNGAKLFPRVGDDPSVLLRRRLLENSTVDAYSAVDAGATADHFLLYVGDWQQYVILDRIGTVIHFADPTAGPNIGSNNRPEGKVGWYVYWRVGADRLTVDAFRVLSIPTTA